MMQPVFPIFFFLVRQPKLKGGRGKKTNAEITHRLQSEKFHPSLSASTAVFSHGGFSRSDADISDEETHPFHPLLQLREIVLFFLFFLSPFTRRPHLDDIHTLTHMRLWLFTCASCQNDTSRLPKENCVEQRVT